MDIYDPLLRRMHRFGSGWNSEDPLRAALLLESPEIDRIRAGILQAELAREPREIQWQQESPPAERFEMATTLPELITATWRRAEPWRRLTEERLAGRGLLILRELLEPSFTGALAAALEQGPLERFQTEAFTGEKYCNVVLHEMFHRLRSLLTLPSLRELMGLALGLRLPAGLTLNGWRLGPGDRFTLHPDGHAYHATFALGLNEGWRAEDGGAIAFGEPGPDGMIVRERWLPFAGDLCCFVPHAQSWHLVEPPARPRLTLSGWWVVG